MIKCCSQDLFKENNQKLESEKLHTVAHNTSKESICNRHWSELKRIRNTSLSKLKFLQAYQFACIAPKIH